MTDNKVDFMLAIVDIRFDFRWQSDYLMGTGCEMYTETLSSSFIGMSFAQAAETCFVKVMQNTLYLAIKIIVFS